MSYGRHHEKKYELPQGSTGPKGKLGFKPKDSDKEVIEKSTEKLLKESEASEGE